MTTTQSLSGQVKERRGFTRRDELLLYRVWLAYEEISSSFEQLNNIPTYLRRIPSGTKPKIERVSWLDYHVENYLNETYIFKERVRAFFELLGKAYRKQQYSWALNEVLKQLKMSLTLRLNIALEIRNSHVHQRRLSDPDLRDLYLVRALVKSGAQLPNCSASGIFGLERRSSHRSNLAM